MKSQTVSLLCLAAASSVSALENQPFANWLTVDGTWGACDKWASGHCTITCTDALLDGVTATVQESDDIRAITLTNDGLLVLDNALLGIEPEFADCCADLGKPYVPLYVGTGMCVVETSYPTTYPTAYPTAAPTATPTANPTAAPTTSPTPACVPGRFVNGTLYDNDGRCDDCPHGKVSNVTNAESCVACANGRYAVATDTLCSDCEIGKYHETTGETCKNCDNGTYSSGTAAISCVHCEHGKYQNSTDYTKCTKCPTGTWSGAAGMTGVTECVAIPTPYPTASPTMSPTPACVPGTFLEVATCVTCDVGTFSAVYNAASCTNCGAGTYGPSANSTDCKSCDAGMWSNNTGNSACTNCPSGKWQDASGSTDCIECQAGKYHTGSAVAATAETHCSHCPFGQYQNLPALTVCHECPSGKYTDQLPTTSCKSCQDPVDELRYWWTGGDAGHTECVKHPLDCGMAPAEEWSSCTKSCHQVAPTQTCCDDNHAQCKACEQGITVVKYCMQAFSTIGTGGIVVTPGCEHYPDSFASYDGVAGVAPTPAPVDAAYGDQYRYIYPTYHAWGGGKDCPQTGVFATTDQDWMRWIAPGTAISGTTGAWEEMAKCNTHSCPIDCVISPWDVQRTCSTSMGKVSMCGGGGVATRRRKIHQPAEHGGKGCGATQASTPCNEHACVKAQCHVRHVRCKVAFAQYGRITSCKHPGCHQCDSAMECAEKKLVRTVEVTHDKEYSLVSSQFKCQVEEASATSSRVLSRPVGKEVCVCRCTKHPLGCFQKNVVFKNEFLNGNIFFDIEDNTACSNMCTHHPECTAWEYDSKKKCVLKTGIPEVVPNPNPEILTWAGQTTRNNGCLAPPSLRCKLNQYRNDNIITGNEECLDCPAGHFSTSHSVGVEACKTESDDTNHYQTYDHGFYYGEAQTTATVENP
jgi:hypothetical protein